MELDSREQARLKEGKKMTTLDEMRAEAARLMALQNPAPTDYGHIQGLLIRRAREISAPFYMKLARVKQAEGGSS